MILAVLPTADKDVCSIERAGCLSYVRFWVKMDMRFANAFDGSA
jgi:hypothetical protein